MKEIVEQLKRKLETKYTDAKKWSKGLESNIAESFRCEQYYNTATSTIGGKNGPCVCLSGNRVDRLFGNRLKCNSRIEEKIISREGAVVPLG